MPQYIKSGGVWKPATPRIKHGGIWRNSLPYVKNAGVWKAAAELSVQFHSAHLFENTNQFAWPAGIIPGDIAVVVDEAGELMQNIPFTTPTGWLMAHNFETTIWVFLFVSLRTAIWCKVLTATDLQSNFVGGIENGDKRLMIFRPNIPCSITVQGAVYDHTVGGASSCTVDGSPHSIPQIIVAGAAGGPNETFSGMTTVLGDAWTAAGYKVNNSGVGTSHAVNLAHNDDGIHAVYGCVLEVS